MSGNPYFQFYPSDWLAGTRGLTAAETGVYITLIAMMYEADGPLAFDCKRLARLCGSSQAAFKKAVDGLISAGKLTLDERGLFNRRVEVEIKKRSEKRAAATQSANARWQKTEQKQSKADANASNSHCVRNANQNLEPDIPVTNVTGRDASDDQSDDFAKQVFDRAVAFLGRNGVSERQARGLVGRWRKDHSDAEIFETFSACSRAGAVEPVSWITARLGRGSVVPIDNAASIQRALARLQAEDERKKAAMQ